jgi:hypothetical protein
MRNRTTLTDGFDRTKQHIEVLKNRHHKFLEYFKQFYGPSGLYPNTIPQYTDTEVLAGIVCRGGAFDGDTIDRELIRDMVLTLRGLRGEYT